MKEMKTRKLGDRELLGVRGQGLGALFRVYEFSIAQV